MKKTIFLDPAKEEMIEAAEYYEKKSKGLGASFLAKVRSAIKRIKRDPQAWPEIKYGIRRCLISQFPYGIFYRNDSDKIVIISVMHLHRRPKYWKERL